MPVWKHYQKALSIDDAIQALFQAPGDARLVAGGTDLLLDLHQGRHPPVDTLVDVTCIPEMLKIEERSSNIFIMKFNWSKVLHRLMDTLFHLEM